MKLFHKIFNIISNMIVFGVAIFSLGLHILRMADIKPYIVVSASMEPTILTGSVCLVDLKYRYEEIAEGDIIAYQVSDEHLVTHRVITITDQGFETKGDNNDISDGISTDKENYMGKNIFSIPYLGYAIQIIQSIKGKMIVITIGIAMMLLDVLLEELENYKRVKREIKGAHSKYIERARKN